jgi:hypothetical protein
MTSLQRTSVVVALGFLIQITFILGWIWIGKQDFVLSIKLGFSVLLGFISMATLYPIAAHSGWRKTLLVCVLLSICGVLIYQILGFTIFPGLVKDVEAFSSYHFSISFSVFALGLLGYLLLCIVNRLISRFVDQMLSINDHGR